MHDKMALARIALHCKEAISSPKNERKDTKEGRKRGEREGPKLDSPPTPRHPSASHKVLTDTKTNGGPVSLLHSRTT